MDSTQGSNKSWNVGLWVVQGLLAVAFLGAGVMKSTTPLPALREAMAWVADAPDFLPRFIGLSEIAGALGLVLPTATRIAPKLTVLAASLLAFVMVLAAGTHAMYGEFGGIGANIVLGSLCALVAWGRSAKAPVAPR